MVKRWIAMYKARIEIDYAKCYIEAAEDKMYTEMKRCTRKHKTYEDFTAEFMPIRTAIQMLINRKQAELKQLKLDYENIK